MKIHVLSIAMMLSSLFSVAQKENTEQWRPVYHFTPPKYWTNDPNGLIYLNGVYQLYYQHNPYKNEWGHMSWGHATTTYFLHWNNLPVAMPEDTSNSTTWRFSGCLVDDKNNTSGFGKSGSSPLVAIYTAHQPDIKKESQYIAYSNDGGMNFTQYEKNPVIDLNKEDFRDPNVQWDEANKRWLMVVVVPQEHKAQFYSSTNLKEWKLLSEFGNEGVTDRMWECPSFIQLPVNGDKKATKWVLMTSVGGKGEERPFMQYFIGDWDGTKFTNSNAKDVVLKVDNGNTFYAAIPYNNAPGNEKLLLGWMIPLDTKTSPWQGQMSILRKLSLQKVSDGLRLLQAPASVIAEAVKKSSVSRTEERKNITLTEKETRLNSASSFNTNTNWIEAVIAPGNAKKIVFRLNESGTDKNVTTVAFDVLSNEVVVTAADGDKTHSMKAAAKPVNGKIKLQILQDKSSLEVFVNDGEKVITTYTFPSPDATGISLSAEGGMAKAESIKMYDVLNH